MAKEGLVNLKVGLELLSNRETERKLIWSKMSRASWTAGDNIEWPNMHVNKNRQRNVTWKKSQHFLW